MWSKIGFFQGINPRFWLNNLNFPCNLAFSVKIVHKIVFEYVLPREQAVLDCKNIDLI